MKDRVEKNILEKIKKGEIKIKPKWWFVAEILGVKLVYWVLIVAASVGLSSVYYFFDLYRPNELSEYGELGWNLVIEDFPGWSLLAFLGLIIGGGLLLASIEDNYRKGSGKRILIVTGIVVVLGLLMFLLKIRI